MIFGDYYLAHTYQSVDVEPIDFGPVPAKDWALDGTSGGTGHGQARLAARSTSSSATTSATTSPTTTCGAPPKTAAMVEPVSSRSIESGAIDDAEVVVVAFGTAGKYIRAAVAQMRAEGCGVGYVRPITLVPVPLRRGRRARPTALGRVAVYENNMGQMVDDVRLAVLGRAPVRVHRRAQPRRVGFRHRPRLRRRHSSGARSTAVMEASA